MADFIARIKPRKSSVSGESPTAADLEVSEIAVNTADGKLFVKHTDNTIKEISGSGAGSGTVQDTARTSPLSVTTSSLADGAAEFKTLAGTARSGQFIRIETSHAARVIYYSTTAARTADATRAQGTSPLTSSGVLLEVITTGVQTIEVTPAILYQNSEVGAAGELYLSITNLSGSAAAVEVETVVVPIEGRGIYMSEVTDLLDVDADAPSDGDALVYNNATGNWEPGTISGGGAVDSVNGETGVVSLGIQEMDDFGLNSSTSGFFSFSSKLDGFPGSTDTLGTSEWQALDSATNGAFRIYLPKNESTQLLVGGTEVTLELSTGFSLTATVDNNTTSAAEVHALKWENPHPTGLTQVSDAPAGTALTITSSVLPASLSPLAEGDILQWDDTDQKFKPAQLPVAPVDSVNGETGVISLGIQDMGDYFGDRSHEFTSFELSGSDVGPDEYSGGPLGYLTFARTVGGVDISQALMNTNGRSDTYVQYGDTLVGPFSGTMTFLSGNAYFLDEDSVITSTIRGEIQTHGQSGGSIKLISPLFPLNPPNDGDVLQWDNSVQKFKPAQLPAAPVDSVNGETGAVSLSIQDLGDFALPPSAYADLGTWDNNVGGSFPAAAGEWRVFQSNTPDVLQFFKQDKDGTDYGSELVALKVGDIVEFSSDGGANYQQVTVVTDASFSSGGGGNTTLTIKISDADGTLISAENSVKIRLVYASLATPLADGDALQWDNADQKFKPAQLPAAPVDANSHTLPQLFGIGAHASFDASSGGSFDFATDTIASGNVSNITRTATGKFTIEFDNDFASNAYTAVCTAGDQDHSGGGASPRCVNVVSRSAGSMDIVVERSDDAVQDDEGYIAVMVIGLLA